MDKIKYRTIRDVANDLGISFATLQTWSTKVKDKIDQKLYRWCIRESIKKLFPGKDVLILRKPVLRFYLKYSISTFIA